MDKRKVILVTLCVAMALAFGVHYMNEAGAICDGECGGTASYFLKTFAPQLGNSLIVFTLLWWFGAPAVSKYLEARKSRIERDIEECGRIKAQASERAEKAEQMLSELGEEKRKMRQSYETAAAQECKRIEEDAVSQGERLKRDAKTSFELQSATARRRFEREVVDASIERARKEIEARLAQDASLRDKLIERSIASFEL